jgi:hypothetical protein
MMLPATKQTPIDDLVEQRIVARLIIKNSLNKRLKQHLVTTHSTTKDECYPDTISDALALLSTFANQGNDTPNDEAVVSYHEAISDIIHDDDSRTHYSRKQVPTMTMALPKRSSMIMKITPIMLPSMQVLWPQSF